jgi:hypothetical protein
MPPGDFPAGGHRPQAEEVARVGRDCGGIGHAEESPAHRYFRLNAYLDGLACGISNDQRDGQSLAWFDAEFRGVQSAQMFDAVGGPEAAVVVPRTAELEGGRGWLARRVAGSALVGDTLRHNAGEHVISNGGRVHERFAQDEARRLQQRNRMLEPFGAMFAHGLLHAAAALGTVNDEFFGRDLTVRDVAPGRDVRSSVLRALAVEELGMRGVREVVDFLGLPRAEAIQAVLILRRLGGWGDLLGKGGRVAGEIERLGRKDSGCLMVAVVFSGDAKRKPRKDYGRAGEADKAHETVETIAVLTGGQGFEGVLGGGVGSIQIPHIDHAERGRGTHRLHDADVPHGRRLLGSNHVDAAIAAGGPDNGDPLARVDLSRHVRGRHDLVVGVGYDHEDVGLEALVGWAVVARVRIVVAHLGRRLRPSEGLRSDGGEQTEKEKLLRRGENSACCYETPPRMMVCASIGYNGPRPIAVTVLNRYAQSACAQSACLRPFSNRFRILVQLVHGY